MRIYAILLVTLFFTPMTDALAIESQDFSCPALMDKKLYDQNKLDAYKTLSPGKDGFVFRTETDFKSDFSVNKKTIENLSDLNSKFKNKGTTLVLFFIPTRGILNFNAISDDDKKLYDFTSTDAAWASYIKRIEDLNNAGIVSAGVNKAQTGDMNDFFYKRDHHWRSEGARIGAEAVAEKVKTIAAYKEIAKQDYVTVKSKPVSYKGRFASAYKTLCHKDLPAEMATKYITSPANSGNNDADALFGENDKADIVLVGTSNSVDKSTHTNFDGFLKEKLHANVLNLSKTGGGFSDSMLEYLASPQFKTSPPKIVIWEIPAYYGLNKQNSFYDKAALHF